MQRSELVEKLQAFSTPTVLIPMWAWLWMKPIGLVFDLDFLLQIVEEKNGHGENIDKRKRKGNINQTNFIHKYDGTYLLLSWFPILSYWLAKMENRNFQTQKRFWMKSHCRGDFWISSYWLALTRNFKITTDLLFFRRKGESSKNPSF